MCVLSVFAHRLSEKVVAVCVSGVFAHRSSEKGAAVCVSGIFAHRKGSRVAVKEKGERVRVGEWRSGGVEDLRSGRVEKWWRCRS